MWFSKVKRLYRSADFFGHTFELNHKGHNTFKTSVGATATLATMGVLLWYAIRLIFQVVDRSNPVSSRLTEVKLDAEPFELNGSDMIPAFVMLNKTGQSPIPNNYTEFFMTLQMEIVTQEYSVSNLVKTSTKRYFPIKPCGQISNKKLYSKLYAHQTLKGTQDLFLNCLDISEKEAIKIFGTVFDASVQSARFVAYPCSLPDSSKCMPESLINQIVLATIDYKKFVDFSDFDNPIRYDYNIREELHLMPRNGIILTRTLSQVKVQDITNSLTGEPSKTTSFSQINEEQTYVMPRSSQNYCPKSDLGDELKCESYVRIDYKYSGVIDTYTRTYPDIFSGFAEFGGFKELVISGVFFLLYFYNNHTQDKYVQLQFLNLPSPQLLADNIIVKDVFNKEGNLETLGFNQPQSRRRSTMGDLQIERDSSKGKSLGLNQRQILKTEGNFKSEEKKCLQWVKEHVENLIETSSDFVNIVKEINNWKIIKEIIFTPYQLKLIPLISVEIERKRKAFEEERKRESREESNSLLKNLAIKRLVSFVDKSLTYNDALKKLFSALEKRSLEPRSKLDTEIDSSLKNQVSSNLGEFINDFQGKIDLLIKDNLPDFIAPCEASHSTSSSNQAPAENLSEKKEEIDWHLEEEKIQVEHSQRPQTKSSAFYKVAPKRLKKGNLN